MSAKPHEKERSRIAALEAYDILDTPPEETFEDLVRLAALICDAPIAQINFIDGTRLWTKASVGVRGWRCRAGKACARWRSDVASPSLSRTSPSMSV